MNVKRIITGSVVLNVLACVATAAAALILGSGSITELLDVATYVGLVIGALWALMFVGASSGSSASTGMAASAADQPSRIMAALWLDRNSGFATGAPFVLGGVSWLGFAWLAALLLGR
jgi:hypothetical protein